jgi:hypothetical protein
VEAALVYAALVAVADVGARHCVQPTFLPTVVALVNSPFPALQRVAMKIIYNAVQTTAGADASAAAASAGGDLVRATLVSGLPRKTVTAMCEPVIAACLRLLRRGAAGAPSPFSLKPSPAVPDADADADADTGTDRAQWCAALQDADVSVLTSLLVEAVVVVTALFDGQPVAGSHATATAGAGTSSGKAAAAVTDDEARALAVVCEGLVEVAVAQPAASPLSASLWAALRRLSAIRRCAVVLAGPRFVALLMTRVRDQPSAPPGALTAAPPEVPRFVEMVNPLQTLAHISTHCPEELSQGLTADQSTLSSLFALLKRATVAAADVNVVADGANGPVDADADAARVETLLLDLFAGASCANVGVCEALAVFGSGRRADDGDDRFLTWWLNQIEAVAMPAPPATWPSLETRLALVANVARCEAGADFLLAKSLPFLDQLCSIVSDASTGASPDAVFSSLAVIVAVVPTLLCLPGAGPAALRETMLLSALRAAAGSHDLLAVDAALTAALQLAVGHADGAKRVQQSDARALVTAALARVSPPLHAAAGGSAAGGERDQLRSRCCDKALRLVAQVLKDGIGPLLSAHEADDRAAVTPEGHAVVAQLTAVLARGPRTVNWLPALLRAAELVQMLVLHPLTASEFVASMQAAAASAAATAAGGGMRLEQEVSSHVLVASLTEINTALQPGKHFARRPHQHAPISL